MQTSTCQCNHFTLAFFLTPVETDVIGLVAKHPQSASCQSCLGSPRLQWQGLTRFSWLGPEKGRGQAKRAIVLPPGAAPDRLGTSGQIWEGNVDGGAWEGPAAREPPCSRAASLNSLLTTKQTREKAGCRTSACDLLLLPCTIHINSQS